MKKLIAILCAVMLILTCSISVFAAGDGTITIEDAVEGQQYSIYKILDLSYAAGDTSEDAGAYTYTVNDAWKDFFDSTKNTTHTKVFEYINIDNDGVVSWEGEDSDTRAGEFAKLALSWAKDNNIAATGTDEAAIPEGESKAVASFTGLDYGYYLLDSSLGALCSLTTTTPNAKVREKNSVPTVDKVIDDGSENGTKANTAMIGETINFKSTITVNEDLEALTWYDTMSAGLKYNEPSLVIKVGDTLLTAGAEADYNIVEDSEYTIKVEFTKDFLEKLTDNTEIVITYNAVLDTDAEIGETGNTNTVYITYGNGPGSTPVTTTTYTYEFDLVKDTNTNTLLGGAEFELYDAANNKIELIESGEDDVYNYRVATKEEIADPDTVTTTVIKTNASEVVTISGLGNGSYYLKETKAPTGYNPVTGNIAVTITNSNQKATMNNTTYEEGGIEVENLTGNILPETGGMGTTLFIAIGAIVVLVTGVILVARKRMSKYVA